MTSPIIMLEQVESMHAFYPNVHGKTCQKPDDGRVVTPGTVYFLPSVMLEAVVHV